MSGMNAQAGWVSEETRVVVRILERVFARKLGLMMSGSAVQVAEIMALLNQQIASICGVSPVGADAQMEVVEIDHWDADAASAAVVASEAFLESRAGRSAFMAMMEGEDVARRHLGMTFLQGAEWSALRLAERASRDAGLLAVLAAKREVQP